MSSPAQQMVARSSPKACCIPEANPIQESKIDPLVDILLWLSLKFTLSSDPQTNRDPLMLAYWERVLNGLVYELYFPEEIHGAGLHLFDLVEKAKLPDVKGLAEKDRLPRLRQKFEELHDGAHPLRITVVRSEFLHLDRLKRKIS